MHTDKQFREILLRLLFFCSLRFSLRTSVCEDVSVVFARLIKALVRSNKQAFETNMLQGRWWRQSLHTPILQSSQTVIYTEVKLFKRLLSPLNPFPLHFPKSWRWINKVCIQSWFLLYLQHIKAIREEVICKWGF